MASFFDVLDAVPEGEKLDRITYERLRALHRVWVPRKSRAPER